MTCFLLFDKVGENNKKTEGIKQMKLSDRQIEHVLSKTEYALRHNRVHHSKQANIILTLKSYLTEDGINIDVCHECLGTGKKQKGL